MSKKKGYKGNIDWRNVEYRFDQSGDDDTGVEMDINELLYNESKDKTYKRTGNDVRREERVEKERKKDTRVDNDVRRSQKITRILNTGNHVVFSGDRKVRQAMEVGDYMIGGVAPAKNQPPDTRIYYQEGTNEHPFKRLWSAPYQLATHTGDGKGGGRYQLVKNPPNYDNTDAAGRRRLARQGLKPPERTPGEPLPALEKSGSNVSHEKDEKKHLTWATFTNEVDVKALRRVTPMYTRISPCQVEFGYPGLRFEWEGKSAVSAYHGLKNVEGG